MHTYCTCTVRLSFLYIHGLNYVVHRRHSPCVHNCALSSVCVCVCVWCVCLGVHVCRRAWCLTRRRCWKRCLHSPPESPVSSLNSTSLLPSLPNYPLARYMIQRQEHVYVVRCMMLSILMYTCLCVPVHVYIIIYAHVS